VRDREGGGKTVETTPGRIIFNEVVRSAIASVN
jgi:hypothetical protein